MTNGAIQLTWKQLAYLKSAADGKTAKQQAKDRGVHYRTIERALSDARAANSAHNLPHLVAMAMRAGLLE